jgi:hypothetical protein
VTSEPPRQPQIGLRTPEPRREPQIGPVTPTGGKTMIYPVIKQYPINDKGGAAGL